MRNEVLFILFSLMLHNRPRLSPATISTMNDLHPLRRANSIRAARAHRIPALASLLDLVRKSRDVRARGRGVVVVNAAADGDGGPVVAYERSAVCL